MKKVQASRKIYRQGDVLLCRIDHLPKAIREVSGSDRFILAEGEATGHHHSVEAGAGVSLYRRGESRMWLAVEKQTARLEHQEHAPIDIPLGFYEVRRQREFDPKGERRVHD